MYTPPPMSNFGTPSPNGILSPLANYRLTPLPPNREGDRNVQNEQPITMKNNATNNNQWAF